MQQFENIDAYISGFPEDIRKRLSQVRKAISSAAPEASETISYGMPAFWLEGPLVYFAAYKNHIGFYPTASGIRNFEKELQPYTYSKGAIQFPHSEQLPLALIQKITRARVTENRQKATAKKGAARKKASSEKNGQTFIAGLSAPASRALSQAGIYNLHQLSCYSESRLLALHGLGPTAIPKIKTALSASGLRLSEQ
ncbi:MAG: DUF1801 domain-containing protein [Chitinophagaceae bacterium]